MRRLLGLLLALVAPAQAAIHFDGFEAPMPVSDWKTADSCTKDGALSRTVSVPITGASEAFLVALNSATFSSGDFPTTPNRIVGFEVRISARASHPGVSIVGISIESSWTQLGGSLGMLSVYGSDTVTSPDFDIGDAGDLADTDYIGAGGYAALVNNGAYSETGPLPGVARNITLPAYWMATSITALGEAPWPYVKDFEYLNVLFASSDGYNATLYVDAVEFRLHYSDASTVAMSGSGTMAVTLQKMKPISRALSGGGTIAATMNANRVIAADMAGSGRISPVLTRDSGGTIYRYLMPELSGSGTMAITPLVRYAPIPAAMSGGGTMSATLQRGHGIKASAPVAMSVTGTLAQSMAAQRPIARALSGVGTVVASVVARRPIAAALSGSGVQTIAMLARRPVSAAMRGVGSLAVTIQRILGSQPVAASMEGSGSMAVDLIAHRPVAAAMTGAGAVNADGLTINTRLAAPEGRSFYAADDAMAFIAPDDFLTFEAQE